MTRQLAAFPPLACIDAPVRFSLLPPADGDGTWALFRGEDGLGTARPPDDAVVAAFPFPGVLALAARGRSRELLAELDFEVVAAIEGELWRLLDARGDPELAARWRDDVCRREKYEPGRFDEELRQLRLLRERLEAEVGDRGNRERWLRTRPLVRLPWPEREDALQDCVARALQRGWQLRTPGEFGGWFYGVRVHHVKDWFRRAKMDRDHAPGRPADPPPRDAPVIDQVVSVARSLQAGKAPGRNGLRTAVEELLEVLSLGDGDRAAAWEFLLGLGEASPHLLELHLLRFGQERHAARLPADDPRRPAAERLAAGLADLTRNSRQTYYHRGIAERLAAGLADLTRAQEGKARGEPIAPTVERFEQAQAEAYWLAAERPAAANPALGQFFDAFARRFPALQVLAPCRRLARYLAGAPGLPDPLAQGLREVEQILEQGTWTVHLDTDTRKRLGCWGQDGRPHADDPALAPPNRAALRLLLLWLSLAGEHLDGRWLGRLADADRRWWQSRDRQAGLDEADEAVTRLYQQIVGTAPPAVNPGERNPE